MEQAVTEWSVRLRVGIETLDDEERQQLLRLVLHRVTLDLNGRLRLVLAIPTQELIADEKLAS